MLKGPTNENRSRFQSRTADTFKCPLDCIQEQNETITTIRKTFVQKHLIVTKSPLQCRSKRK